MFLGRRLRGRLLERSLYLNDLINQSIAEQLRVVHSFHRLYCWKRQKSGVDPLYEINVDKVLPAKREQTKGDSVVVSS